MPKGEYLQYGGQALIGGVMMRSPRFYSVACRAPSGELVVKAEPVEKTWIGRQKWLKLPFLRGSFALIDGMVLGSKAMKFAANVQVAPEYLKEEDRAAAQAALDAKPKSKATQDTAIALTVAFGLVFGLILFNYVPNVVAEFSQRAMGTKDYRVINVVSETVKIVMFLGYIALIGQLPEIKEVFMYHGAEHKAINTLEADQPLEMKYCLAQTRLHPRCGTSFAIIVLLLSLVCFTFVPRYPFGKHSLAIVDVTIRFGIELLVLPFIAGAAYELLRLAGKFRNTTLVNIAFAPGLWSQYITTREPREDQIEVSLAALKACMDAEESGLLPDAKPNKPDENVSAAAQ